MLPSAYLDCVGVLIASFRSSIPSPPIPLFTLRCTPHGAQRKTRGRVVRYSFLVGLFHSLIHAGLSRRTKTPVSRHSRSLRSGFVRKGQGQSWHGSANVLFARRGGSQDTEAVSPIGARDNRGGSL